MKVSFRTAIIISLAAHVGLLAALVYYNGQSDVPFGDGMVAVEIIGDGANASLRPATKYWRGNNPLNTTESGSLPRSSNDNASNGASENSGGGTDGGIGAGSLTGNPILTKIRQKIERAKYYPPEAKRQKIEGRPEVTFQINPDGTLANATLKSSSGNENLDNAALETVKRAAPFPYYERPISLAIKYSLND